jgi:hypothetical protein
LLKGKIDEFPPFLSSFDFCLWVIYYEGNKNGEESDGKTGNENGK